MTKSEKRDPSLGELLELLEHLVDLAADGQGVSQERLRATYRSRLFDQPDYQMPRSLRSSELLDDPLWEILNLDDSVPMDRIIERLLREQ